MALRTRLKKHERRQVLLETAERLFSERGYRKTEVEQVAKECGVTKPIIYKHFPQGKAELFMAVLDQHISRLMRVLWEAMASSTDPRERLHRGLDAYFGFAEEHPDGFHLLAGATSEIDPEIGERLAQVRETIVRGLATTIADVMRAAGLSIAGSEIYAHALLGGSDSVIDWWLRTRTISRSAVIDYLLAFVWRGFDGLPRDPTRFHRLEKSPPAGEER
ncbi:MAG: TetR/AcrR family transcriptional regulator [Actinomycetota bacterium]